MNPNTHILVTKDGYEEYMAKTTWEGTKAAPDGSRGGYFMVSSKPPEVEHMEQIRELKSKTVIAAEVKAPVLDPVLENPVVEEEEVKTKRPYNKKK